MEALSKAEIIRAKIEIKNNRIELNIRIKEVDGCAVDEEYVKTDEISVDLEKFSITGKEEQSGRPIEITYHRNNHTASIKVSRE